MINGRPSGAYQACIYDYSKKLYKVVDTNFRFSNEITFSPACWFGGIPV